MDRVLTTVGRSSGYDEEHDAYRESFRTHLEREVVAELEGWESAGCIPRTALRAAAEHGYCGVTAPEELGGAGLDDPRFAVIVAEESAAVGATAFGLTLLAHDHVPVRALAAAPAGERRDDRLRGLATAELVATTALEGRVSARDSDDRILLCGQADAVINGVGADLLLIRADAADGPMLSIVERDAVGLEISPVASPIGLKGAGLATVVLSDVAVSRRDLVERGLIERLIAGERLLTSALAVGAARRAIALMAEYVADRRAFGTSIASFPNTRDLVGEAIANLAAASALLERCVAEWVDGVVSAHTAAAAKLVATRALDRAVDSGVQLHGGYGYMLEYPIATAFTDARFLLLHGGSPRALRDVLALSALA